MVNIQISSAPHIPLSENLPTLPTMQLAASVGDAGVLGL